MPNIKLTLQYDGTRYLGWTRPAADGYARNDRGADAPHQRVRRIDHAAGECL